MNDEEDLPPMFRRYSAFPPQRWVVYGAATFLCLGIGIVYAVSRAHRDGAAERRQPAESRPTDLPRNLYEDALIASSLRAEAAAEPDRRIGAVRFADWGARLSAGLPIGDLGGPAGRVLAKRWRDSLPATSRDEYAARCLSLAKDDAWRAHAADKRFCRSASDLAQTAWNMAVDPNLKAEARWVFDRVEADLYAARKLEAHQIASRQEDRDIAEDAQRAAEIAASGRIPSRYDRVPRGIPPIVRPPRPLADWDKPPMAAATMPNKN